jgi:hypothetical protein
MYTLLTVWVSINFTINVDFCINVALYVLSRGLKQPECESDHSCPPIAEVKYQWSCTYGVVRNNFTLTLGYSFKVCYRF